MLGYPSNLTLFYAEHFLTLAQKIDLTILSFKMAFYLRQHFYGDFILVRIISRDLSRTVSHSLREHACG